MPARYAVRLLDHSFSQVAFFDSWRSLTIDEKLNGISTTQLVINGADSRSDLFFTPDYMLQVQRNIGTGWYTEFMGFIRTPQRQLTETDLHTCTIYARSFEDLLHRRGIAYKSPLSVIGPADDVMKQLVNTNAGPGATSPPRLFNGVTFNLQIAPSTASAPTYTRTELAYRNLFDVLVEIATAAGVDFTVSLTPANEFEFRTYYPQLGIDRTISTGMTPQIFSLGFANMRVPSYTKSRTEEITSVIVAGQGEEAARVVIQQDSPAVSDSPWNRIELMRDARNETTIDGLNTVAATELQKGAARENFTFSVIQTPASVYGRDYALGDLVTIQFNAQQADKKLIGVHINVNADSVEALSFDFGDLDPVATSNIEALGKAIRNIVRRLAIIENSGAI